MKRLYFLCMANVARSVMAERFARAWGQGHVEAFSGGIHRGKHVSRNATAVMLEVGIDISDHVPRRIDWRRAERCDRIVDVGTGRPVCPQHLEHKFEAWTVEDPHGTDLEVYRGVRDTVARNVAALLEREGIAVPADAPGRR